MTVFRGACPRRVWRGGRSIIGAARPGGLEGEMGTKKEVDEPTDYMVLVDRDDDNQWTIEKSEMSRDAAQAEAHIQFATEGHAFDCIRIARECPITVTIDD